MAPCGGDDYDAEEAGKESYGKDKGGYAIAMTDSPIAKRRRSTGFTATVSTAHSHYVSSAESTPTSTPDFKYALPIPVKFSLLVSLDFESASRFSNFGGKYFEF